MVKITERQTNTVANVYYVGDWALAIGPLYAESPFNCGHKGAEVFNDSTWRSKPAANIV